MILSIDNVINQETCDLLIKIFNNNKDLQERHDDSHSLRCKKLRGEDFNFTYKISRYLNNLITKHTGDLIYHDNVQIVLKPPLVEQPPHNDYETSFITSITYLNTLKNGETFFEDFGDIKPKAGRTVIFNGHDIVHGSKKASENRYTFIAWYSKDVNKLDSINNFFDQ